MRQYGDVPAWLSTAAAPMVLQTTGLGVGGGASVQSKDGQCFGEVFVQTGAAPAASGSVVLSFPQTQPTMFFSGDEEFGALTIGAQGVTPIAIGWNLTLPPRRLLRLQYEWSVSK
jgi:hypothetical protein